jgi:hypothetical protein
MVNRYLTISRLGTAGVLAAGLFAGSAQSAEPGSWYVGGSSDSTDVVAYGSYPFGTGRGGGGLSVRGGLRVQARFGVEFQALRASDLRWSQYLANIPYGINAHTTFDVSALQTAAVGNWAWGPIFEAYLKGGLALYDVDGRQVIDTLTQDAAATRAVSDGGSHLLFGVGLRMKATPKWAVRLDYQTFGIDGDFLGDDSKEGPTLDTLSVGVDYRFGKTERRSVNDRSRDKDNGQ